MAEIAVLLVVKKIGLAVAGETLKYARPLLAKKPEFVAALPDEMKLIRNELELVHAFLKGIAGKGWKGEVIETWIRQVRRLAYNMEDMVDQFIYVVGKQNQKGSWWDHVKKIIMKPQSLFSLSEIANEVKRINQELKQLSESRDRWTKALDGGSDIPIASYGTEHQMYLPGHDYSINDEELVGTEKNQQTLIESLHFEDSSLRIIAVWGMGGIGKSTLVNSVYKSEACSFDLCAWVPITQSYKLEDTWRKMLRDLLGKDKKEFDLETMNSFELREQLTKILDKKRYIIILDDVWTAEVLFKIREVLIDNSLGSRVIITTRIEEVASIAEDDCKIKVEPLNDHDAWILFCRKAFPKIRHHICPPELIHCGIDIMEKCDGLPLALVAVGSILSLKAKSVKEWKLFNNQLIWELHNNENLNHVEKVLNLSYKSLPDYLKNCFLYCAMFPEDDLIHRKRLIRLWIAEGFIEQKGACSLEDIAEGYLGELVQRSMLQVVERNSFGRIRCLQMHDLVRELAIFLSKNESFCTVYDSANEVVHMGSHPRRVSVLYCSDIRSSLDPSRLRTYIAFNTSTALPSWCSFIVSESKYLAVLDLSGLPIEIVPNSVGELFNLRFLSLNETNVKELPRSITKLHNLHTLSLQCTQLLKFPRGLSKLNKLRYLAAWRLEDATHSIFNCCEAMEPFQGLWHLKELQTLEGFKASTVFVAKLGNLSQLRTLKICDIRSSHCAQLCNSLSKMHQLSRLLIRACREDELLHLDNLAFTCPLQKLHLYGQLSNGTLTSPFFLNHGNSLLQIDLWYCQLTENQLSILSGLSNLTLLSLRKVHTGQKLHFNVDWFRNLKKIYLWDLAQVNQICIQAGALLSLEHLEISGLQELRDVPLGVDHLTSLKEARFVYMHPEFSRNFHKAKLDHVPNVYLTTTGN